MTHNPTFINSEYSKFSELLSAAPYPDAPRQNMLLPIVSPSPATIVPNVLLGVNPRNVKWPPPSVVGIRPVFGYRQLGDFKC